MTVKKDGKIVIDWDLFIKETPGTRRKKQQFTEHDIKKMCEAYEKGISYKAIARMLTKKGRSVSDTVISRIVRDAIDGR